MRRDRIAKSPFFSRTIPQLHGHRAERSHNSMGTALKKGETPGDEAAQEMSSNGTTVRILQEDESLFQVL